MKKILTAATLVLLLAGCAQQYDDSTLQLRISSLENRVDELESNVQALQSAVGDGVFVQKVEEYNDPETGRTTGVTVTYTTGKVVHFSIVPADPTVGPVLSVMKNGAGELCWAIDGILIQKDGADVPVYHTPSFAIDENSHLLVTVDGETIDLGNVKGDKGEDGTVPVVQESIIKGLEVTEEAVIITYDNGTVAIPLATAFELLIEKKEYLVSSTDPIDVAYTVKNKTENTVVDVFHGKEFTAEVQAEKIVVTPKSKDAEGQMLVYADSKSGLTSIVKLDFAPEFFAVSDEAADPDNNIDYIVDADGGTLIVNAVSNLEFDVKPEAEWIHYVKTRAQSYVVELRIDENKASEIRTGSVSFVKAGTETVVQTVTIGQKAAVAGAKNLSKNGPANCYIVTDAGDYKFWAVKGNSNEEVAAASVEVLWETWNNSEEVTANSVIASVSLEGSYVKFSTPETLKPGNAVIAAKDAGGVILWSWHIWVPATAIQTNTYGLLDKPLMDRNLGALVAATEAEAAPVESLGLTYQWGRKDPFPGPKALNSGSNAVVAGKALEEAPGQISLEESIANPTLLGHKDNEDWLSAPDNTLWNNEAKSMYDPCPPGYRVPALDETKPMWSSDLSTVAGWGADTDKYWFKMGEPAAVFPFAGYRDDYSVGSMTHAYDRAVIWSAASSSDVKGAMLNVRGTSTHALGSAPKARAGSVRCVVADETPILPPEEPDQPTVAVVDLSEAASANSYVITAAGDYKFKAVKGNSAESVGSVAKAELLWETVNTDTAPEVNAVIAQVGVDGEYITFSTPGTLLPGNALIAAKDASDAILWSWHIWIPATEVSILDAEAFCGAKMMDRNLGALVATSMTGDADPLSIGVFYQWGRKDPFPGMTSLSSNSGAKVAGTEWTAHTELVNTAYSVAHPTEYVHIPEVDDGVWNADDPKDLWNTEDNKKTIYDPCPAGYRVPMYDSSLPMWGGAFNESWTIDADNHRFAFGDVVFPVCGYIDCWTPGYEKSGQRTHIWGAKWYDEKRSTCLYYRDGKYYSQKFHKAKAGSVRCVVE